MREIWGYDVRRPGPIRWRWALFLAWMAALGGCCTYHGKPVSRSDATVMKGMGMDVSCIPENFCGKRP